MLSRKHFARRADLRPIFWPLSDLSPHPRKCGRSASSVNSVFSQTSWSYAVQYDKHSDGGDHLAEIWRRAELRRAEEFYRFFMRVFRRTHVFGTRLPVKSPPTVVQPQPSRIAPAISGFLDVTRTG